MIQLKNIYKNYLSGENEVHALTDININFRNNEFVSILGPSGCGKTTFLNIFGGLDKYTSGDIVINGVSTKEYKDKDWDAYRNHYIGFIFQSYNLISHLSILENVELALTIAGISPKEKKKRALKALKEVGLSDQIHKKPNQLSGGQMQRVAIARAIVNEPKIILADEPTGALDSETSVQVMNLLKKISSKYLIIMVTHNEKLADDYSTRIIKLLDGKLIGDSNPYNPSDDEIQTDKIELEKIKEKDENKKKQKKIKSSMSYWSSFVLSVKNIWSKKGKTIIESLAGSIGIIGIALVLAVGAGFTNYINNLQTNTLGGYPLSISTIAIDYDAVYGGGMKGMNEKKESNDSFSVYNPSDMAIKLGHFNYFSDDFVKYIDDYIDKDAKSYRKDIKYVNYDYGQTMKFLTKQPNGMITYINSVSSTSVMTGNNNDSVKELIDDKEWILENYDLIGKYSESPNELMLVVGPKNKFDNMTVRNYGFPYETEIVDGKLTIKDIKYQDVIDKCEYTIILNNDYYIKTVDGFDVINIPSEINPDNSEITSIFNNAKSYEEFDKINGGSFKLKISGILKAREDSELNILGNGLYYNKQLSDLVNSNSKNSEIYKYTENLIQNNINNGKTGDDVYKIQFPWIYEINVAELSTMMPTLPTFKFDSTYSYIDGEGNNVEGMVEYVNNRLNTKINYKQAYDIALQTIGASSTPFNINFYPTSFDAKEKIINYINDWNNDSTHNTNQILYTDATGMLTDSMGQMVDIISYVLVAFAGISLVVSSIMIGIITYTSVIERTKEIGVLRSIGAKKKDISRIFNNETMLIGFFAGLIGVVFSWILTFPISAIIKAVAGGVITTNMAILKFSDAAILVLISTLLTTLAGTIPAYIASKKDPVTCLRSE